MAKPSSDDQKRNAVDEFIPGSSPTVEPPPMSRPTMPVPYAYPIPFGEPPAEPVTLIEGEIPWELREEQ